MNANRLQPTDSQLIVDSLITNLALNHLNYSYMILSIILTAHIFFLSFS